MYNWGGEQKNINFVKINLYTMDITNYIFTF